MHAVHSSSHELIPPLTSKTPDWVHGRQWTFKLMIAVTVWYMRNGYWFTIRFWLPNGQHRNTLGKDNHSK